MSNLSFKQETFLEDIRRWLEDGGDPRLVDPVSSWTLLHYAAEYLDDGAAEYLITRGCDVNALDRYGQTPLHLAIDSEIDADNQVARTIDFAVARVLVESGADLGVRDQSGRSPLDWVDSYGARARALFDSLVLGLA